MTTEVTSKMNIHKPARDVYEAIADPEKMANYWFSSGTGRVEKDKTITWKYDEYNAEGNIHVLETEENRKIVFTWGGEGEETLVTILFNEQDTASTIIEVTESGFKADDPHIINKLLGQQQGWVYMLTCLKAYLENGINTLRASLVH